MIVLLILLQLFCLQSVFSQVDPNLIVFTKNGPYKGERRMNYYAFEGIRYANPPLGGLRFQSPQAYTEAHTDVWNATISGSNCIQYYQKQVVGEEDCLFLNIYTPNPNAISLMAVIVYIHGGGFIFGSGDQYGPGHLLQRNLVYVNLNYRLGPMGFLSAGNRFLSGNMGLKDQVMALKYIKQNIISFGGNFENITIVGWSAGGASVQLHYLSPLSKGLFARGISHSGSAFNPWVWQSNPEYKFQLVSTLTGCTNGLKRERILCLRNIPAARIVETVRVLQKFYGNPFNPFGVVVEKDTSDTERFITSDPETLIKQDKIQKLPWIVTGVKDEGYYPAAKFLAEPFSLNEINERFSEIMPLILHFPMSAYNDTTDLTNTILEHYMGRIPIDEKTFDYFVKIITDYLYIVGIHKSILLQSSLMPVYAYGFDYKTTYGYGERMSNRSHVTGIAHGEDIVLIYESSMRNGHPYTMEEIQVMNLLLDMYETFASTG